MMPNFVIGKIFALMTSFHLPIFPNKNNWVWKDIKIRCHIISNKQNIKHKAKSIKSVFL